MHTRDQVFFAGTSEGDSVFPDLLRSITNMIILLTTGNSPDVMMPVGFRTERVSMLLRTVVCKPVCRLDFVFACVCRI